MIVNCPNCETTFSMPDELYRPGRKARCSQCSFVFPLPLREEPDVPPQPLPHPESRPSSGHRKKQTLILAAILIICLAGIGYGSFMLYRAFTSSGPVPASSSGTEATPDAGGQAEADAGPEERARKEYEERVRNIALENVYQSVEQNDKIGPIVVVQGEAVNRFSVPKEFIMVEVRLFDANKDVLAAKQQMCGVSLTVFQLQMLGEKELQEALDNRIVILTYNTNIPPEGRVPFFVVFPKVPPAMDSFEVRVADVRDARPEEEASAR